MSPAHLEAMIAIAADAIIATDEEQRILLFNRGAESTFGYTAEEVIGKPLDMLLPPAAREVHRTHLRNFGALGGAARLARERAAVEGRRKNGEVFPAEVSLSHTRVGGISVFTAVLRDISERRQAEAERYALLAREHAAREAAERAARLRDEVLAVVSHDLRNPVATIGMAMAALEDSPEPDAGRRAELIAIARDSLDWMTRLIQDLLDIASIDAGRLSIDRTPDDLVIVLVRAYSQFSQRCQEHGLELVLDTPEHLPGVEIDAERILQVLGNLLSNAVKYTPKGGRIRISATEGEREIVVSVADTGSGIPAPAVPHLFERFWRLQGSSRVRGTGLGLSIANGIVAAHNGRMWVETAVGAGSTFSFAVPLPTGASRESTPAQTGAERPVAAMAAAAR